MLPILGASTGFAGWQWLPALIYAPASGIAQELYFRASLLPALEKWVGKKPFALVLHGLVFIVFHLRTFIAIGLQPIAILVVAGPFRSRLCVGLAGAAGPHSGVGDTPAQSIPGIYVNVRFWGLTSCNPEKNVLLFTRFMPGFTYRRPVIDRTHHHSPPLRRNNSHILREDKMRNNKVLIIMGVIILMLSTTAVSPGFSVDRASTIQL